MAASHEIMMSGRRGRGVSSDPGHGDGDKMTSWNAFHRHCYNELLVKLLPDEFAREQINILQSLEVNSAEDLRQKSINYLQDKGLYLWTLETLNQFYFSPENFGNLVIDISVENRNILKAQEKKYLWISAGFFAGLITVPILTLVGLKLADAHVKIHI